MGRLCIDAGWSSQVSTIDTNIATRCGSTAAVSELHSNASSASQSIRNGIVTSPGGRRDDHDRTARSGTFSASASSNANPSAVSLLLPSTLGYGALCALLGLAGLVAVRRVRLEGVDVVR